LTRTGEAADNKPLGAHRTVIADVLKLARLAPHPRRATILLVILGLAASFAETLGVTLILLFVYAAMGQIDAIAGTGGAIGGALAYVARLFDSPSQIAFVVLLLIALRGALAYAFSLVGAAVSARLSESAMNSIHKQYLSVSYDFIRKHDKAQLMEILGTESWMLATAHANLTRIIVHLCSIVVFGGALLSLSWQVTMIAMAGFMIIFLGLRRLSRPARRIGIEVKRVHRDLGEQMLMTLDGMRTIRAYGLEDVHQRRFVSFSARARDNSIAQSRLSALLNPLTETSYLAILCVIIASGPYLNTSFAAIIGCVLLLYRLQPHIWGIESAMLQLMQVEPQLRSVHSMLETKDKHYPIAGNVAFTQMREGISFDDVSFGYRDNQLPVLSNVSFEIPAGKVTALVGASGAGKTTIVNLLLRLYRPDLGDIKVDGTDLDELSRRDWLGQLAVAGQDVELVEGTVADNIRMARGDATLEEVIEAAGIAGVHEFVAPLEDGYDSWIGQEGLNFSGGQRQRLGLARAILRNPQLLILDEAMSALDRDLEDRIRAALDKRFKGRTLLLITHRVETVLSADHIVCISNGRIVSSGLPQTIMNDPASPLARYQQPGDKPSFGGRQA
jgi:ABC-type multidrug transport system fused ATPase/permease subunit